MSNKAKRRPELTEGGLLIWCAAAALCIAATLQPDFRIQSSS